MKVLTILGARPQFIKASTLSRAFLKNSKIQEIIVHTGQHFDAEMSDVFFDELKIPKPKYNLGIHSLNHGAMTGRMLEEIEKILFLEKPDIVLVYGDTNSTLAGALAAKKLQISVAHVEAGLRSHNMKMPEEINRILTDQISDLLFCPTEKAVENLKNEGFPSKGCSIEQSGDVMYDAVLFYAGHSKPSTAPYIVCTVHREENTSQLSNLIEILKGMNKIAENMKIVFPVHPRTKNLIPKTGIELHSKIELVEPKAYGDMISLLKNCELVMTDSGGLQKEAYFLEKPCLTLREETEWIELVQVGANILCGANSDRIFNAYAELSVKKIDFSKSLYGDGNSADFIVKKITSFVDSKR
jgi:UDP-GlcNAc3NAcA epimerase